MKIHYWKSKHGNFGDDLNGWIWSENSHNKDIWNEGDNISFVGVGTVLDNNIPKDMFKAVLGSGAGYALPPFDIDDSKKWKIYGVRGVLTARLLNISPDLALTDPAILVANMDKFKATKKEGVIFIPHFKSIGYGAWEAICFDLGIEYVSPCGAADDIIKRIGSAELVLAESMHAAIIADALRTPWIAVATSPEIMPFKWADWSMSLGMPYKPVCLAPSSMNEYIRNIVSKFGYHCTIFQKGLFTINSPLRQLEFSSIEEIEGIYQNNMKRAKQKWRASLTGVLEAIIKRTIKGGANNKNSQMYKNAVLQMKELMNMPAMLSDDKAHKEKLEQMLAALRQLESDYEKGMFK